MLLYLHFQTRKVKKICFVWAAAVLTGCSSTPRVTADVTEQLPSQPVEKVAVYDTDASVPIGARAIGKVSVTDGGMTPAYKCLYSNMLALAVRKTAESGGNALHIDEHRTPGFWTSSCHRIWGTMYVLPDSLVDGNAQSLILKMEEENDKELLAMTHEQIARREKMLDNPKDIVKINIGPSWITSEITTPQNVYKSETGLGVGVDYQHFWQSGFGIGINYLYHSTTFNDTESIRVHYVGPSVVYGIKLGDSWRLDVALGIGYSVYKEVYSGYMFGDSSESNIGVLGQLGVEHMFSDRIGIGLQLNTFTMRMKRPDNMDTSKYDFYGIRRLDAQIGLRFYL
jgi:hypothetical protein